MTSTYMGWREPGSRISILLLALGMSLAVVGCGDRKGSGASQVAAKVNKEEISVHQINFVMERQQGLKPEQADAVSRQILERLIDQEIAVQKAEDLKLDRDPRVVRQLEASRREILSRAYLDRAGEAAAKATPDEVKKFYDEKPALFKERRVYSIQELAIEATPDQVDALRTQLQAAKTINEFVDYLKANGIRFNGNQAVRAAEQLPLNMLDAFAKMKDGQTLMVPTAGGVQVVALAGSRNAPIDEATARPAIEQYLLNERKRKVLDENMKSLRAAAQIEYVGKFAEAAASSPAAAGAAAPSTGASAASPSTPTQ
jgi:EpsD family peptidyl-prolyl cis-trans isomerase